MNLELREVARIGDSSNLATITYDIYIDGKPFGCQIIADKVHSYMIKGDHQDTFTLEEMEAITFEMRKRSFKIMVGGA